ncbi:virulence plasmid 65kDa B protein-domain-containing protein [Fusarium oxysporum]|nr:virulence plasmid 65kDa B protein-domain-containing protein [Fusarium oxysporum]
MVVARSKPDSSDPRGQSVGDAKGDGSNKNTSSSSTLLPSISLPKGGGAIRGIGEKFTANPVTGTASMTVPIATSSNRSGFGPQLSLSYDSGAGNGDFGYCWHLSLPTITRKTDKGLPRYYDVEDSDVFILSGAEDLVPVLSPDGSRFTDTTTASGYAIHRFRPRIDTLFARIERWTSDEGDIHWRSISKDNILTIYGKDQESRVADSDDPQRIFSWLICETRDDKGNAVVYEYKREDGTKVNLTEPHERNRGKGGDLRRMTGQHVKHIRYGNRVPFLDSTGQRPRLLTKESIESVGWMFEVVFDYGEHNASSPKPNDAGEWLCRHDPFSSYRAGFEVRNYRLCQRVLMFHHFPDEQDVGRDCLVRSTNFVYRNLRNNSDDNQQGHPICSLIASISQSGYRRLAEGGYLKKSLPPLEFEYSQAILRNELKEVDAKTLENLPVGLGTDYEWVDLDGEGASGILTEEGGTWLYKRNLSPYPPGMADKADQKATACFGAAEIVATKPAVGISDGAGTQLLDISGNGHLDLVQMQGPSFGFYERNEDDDGWEHFCEFSSWPNLDFKDPNQKFVDLTGDGHADILIAEDRALIWYASLARKGFAPQARQLLPSDEDRGPQLLFSDPTGSVYICDMSGDGLSDLVRLRNGEVCYWPNCGYGRFGAKVTMGNAPYFDYPDLFDQRRIRLADIDGSGTCDIIYLGAKQVDIYYNQAGNSWGARQSLEMPFPSTDSLSSVRVVDLLGNGTACLVYSSPLPGDSGRQMRYTNLVGEHKPHLLIKAVNNLGMETHMHYAPSTKFYVQDRAAGKPWVTKLPFVVHVVERVETFDLVGRNRFVRQYNYHHGYFDGSEREFRGFGMVEQLDTELFGAFNSDGREDMLFNAANEEESSQMPPMLTRKWFHVGAFAAHDRISAQFEHEYYREGDGPLGGLGDEQLRGMLLAPTVFPAALHLADGTFTPHSLTVDEMRDACRALKGSLLRQEVYGLDSSPAAGRPYTVTEYAFTIDLLQPLSGNKFAVFATHAREQIDLHYERKLVLVDGKMRADPRMSHSLALEVDAWGNVLRSLTIAYRRRTLPGADELDEHQQTHLTLAVARFANRTSETDWHRVGVPVESRAYEIVKPPEPGITDIRVDLFAFDDMARLTRQLFPLQLDQPEDTIVWPYGQWDWRRNPAHAPPDTRLRLIEHTRTLYRKDDFSGPLPLGQIGSLALPLENYKLAFTPELASTLFVDSGKLVAAELDAVLRYEARYVHVEGDANWWLPSGHMFYSPNATDSLEQELAYARQHWFLALRYRNPFHTGAVSTDVSVRYDAYDLLIQETLDAVGNRITVGERDEAGNVDPTKPGNDYRVLQPRLITDANRNRTEMVFDALGLVVGTAVKGKSDTVGDSLSSFEADLSSTQLDGFYDAADPHVPAPSLLKNATTRVLYDFDHFSRTRKAHPDNPTQWLPVYSCILARETHASDPVPQRGLQIQASFSYSDGFGREIQKKIQSEPGPVVEGEPVVSPRWVATGWTIFNNKGKPVRQYEPYFSQLPVSIGGHHFEFGARTGVSPVLFYDPAERLVATLHPNNTYEKLVFDSWQQTAFDPNDTVAAQHTETGDPRTDADISGYVAGYFKSQPDTWQTWYQQRITGAKGTLEQSAATKAAQHANTPTTNYLDSLGRTVLAVAHNKTKYSDTPAGQPAIEELYHTRVVFDIEGNQREVSDAKDRIVVRHNHDVLGNIVYKFSMEDGERWMLNDVIGNPVRAWDSRGHIFRTEYDPLRRPSRLYITGSDPTKPNQELLAERLVYGEKVPDAEFNNLRNKLYLHLDQAGSLISKSYDFKGNLLVASRQLAREYRQSIDWTTVNAALPADTSTELVDLAALEAALRPNVEEDVFESHTAYDALNRTVQAIAPRSNRPGAKRNITQPVYNEAGLLEQIHVWLDYSSDPGGLLDTSTVPPSLAGVSNIDYDAKGHRLQIFYKNGATSRYREDCGGDPPESRFPSPEAPPPATSCGLQNLNFTYDAKGNLTNIRDDAQQSIYFRNKRVDPSADYTYDATYRLIEATGREHLGQGGGQRNPPTTPNAFNRFHTGLDHPNDGKAMGTYLERYVYDAVGNFKSLRHLGSDPANPGWTRNYQYEENSLIEDGTQGTSLKFSNRLSSTTVGSNDPATERYAYDAHGNIILMPHLGNPANQQEGNMHWDYKDQLRQVELGGGGTAYYTYDARGVRTRKVWEKLPGLVEERIYLGSFEVFRRRNSSGIITLERETLHIVDDEKQIALVESRTRDTVGNDPAPQQLIRYQFSNHLESSSLELDEQAQIISYEEYTPYGSTSYQAVRSQQETPKRYRYAGKERDEESGLCYHGLRYYMPWLGRWASPDPAGLADGVNIYCYVHDSPTALVDSEGTESTDPLERDIVYQIVTIDKPGDVGVFWDKQVRPNRQDWAHPLSQLEKDYIQAFTDSSTPKQIQMRSAVDPSHLTAEEKEASSRLFGSGSDAPAQYANFENRRRIVGHYVWTHPATVQLQLGWYQFFRDVNPLHFALERGWQIGSGKEMFTGHDVSRLGAAGEFLLSLGVTYGLGKAASMVAPEPPTGPTRALTDPIWDLPREGGGMRINGRWYTEHALERMAPNTPEVRSLIRTRVQARFERLGLKPGDPMYDKILTKMVKEIDPRGIPPSVVEAEIARPGSTNVNVIATKHGERVITVMPR